MQTVDIGPISEDQYYELGDTYNGKYTVNVLTGTVTGISTFPVDKGIHSAAVYSLDGRLVRTNGSLDNLPKGVYIMNGKKYVLK